MAVVRDAAGDLIERENKMKQKHANANATFHLSEEPRFQGGSAARDMRGWKRGTFMTTGIMVHFKNVAQEQEGKLIIFNLEFSIFLMTNFVFQKGVAFASLVGLLIGA